MTFVERLYLDCHSTTPVDPIVLAAMLPYFSSIFGNTGSQSHEFGLDAKEAVDQAREKFAKFIGATAQEIVFTSGSTESNNLAIRGVAEKLVKRRKHLISIGTEHPSVIGPLRKLEAEGWRITLIPIHTQSTDSANDSLVGMINLDALRTSICDETALVSVAIANNEIGNIQPINDIAKIAHQAGALLHTDASQAVGWLPINMRQWQADLVSFSAHKFYGPKGMGALYIRSQETYPNARPVRLKGQTVGGGQEFGFRSGTLNTPGIVGMAVAMELANQIREQFGDQVQRQRNRLWEVMSHQLPDLVLNGPALDPSFLQGPTLDLLDSSVQQLEGAGGPSGQNPTVWPDSGSNKPEIRRLPNNLNFAVPGIEGQSIMIQTPEIAMSSGSACSSANPGVSQVLLATGLSEDLARSSLRIGLGRSHSEQEIEWAADRILAGIHKARSI